MDIASVRPVLTGVTSPLPRTLTEQRQSTVTDLTAEKTVQIAEKTDGNTVDTTTDKPRGQGVGAASNNARTAANTLKGNSLDQVSGFDLFTARESNTDDEATQSANSGTVGQDNREFAMRMQAMIEAWQGTGGAQHSAAVDQSV